MFFTVFAIFLRYVEGDIDNSALVKMALPRELKMQILVDAMVTGQDIASYCSTSKEFVDICNDDFFWKQVYERFFDQKLFVKDINDTYRDMVEKFRIGTQVELFEKTRTINQCDRIGRMIEMNVVGLPPDELEQFMTQEYLKPDYKFRYPFRILDFIDQNSKDDISLIFEMAKLYPDVFIFINNALYVRKTADVAFPSQTYWSYTEYATNFIVFDKEDGEQPILTITKNDAIETYEDDSIQSRMYDRVVKYYSVTQVIARDVRNVVKPVRKNMIVLGRVEQLREGVKNCLIPSNVFTPELLYHSQIVDKVVNSYLYRIKLYLKQTGMIEIVDGKIMCESEVIGQHLSVRQMTSTICDIFVYTHPVVFPFHVGEELAHFDSYRIIFSSHINTHRTGVTILKND